MQLTFFLLYKHIDFEEDGENTALGDKATLAPEALTIQPVTVNTLHIEQDKCKGRFHRQTGERGWFASLKSVPKLP